MKLPDIVLPGALALTALLACLQNSAAATGINKHVYGGASASKGDFPFQAHIFFPAGEDGGDSYCGGGIISSRWILTAAHCGTGHLPSQVIVGGVNFNFDDAEMIIDKITHFIKNDQYVPYDVNPYSEDPRNDIGLVGLGEAIRFSENVKAVKLPSYSQPPLVAGTVVYVSGLGHTSDNKNDPPPRKLQYVDLILTDEDVCVQGRLICATATDRAVKHGDSGGPWVWKDQSGVDHIVGIGIRNKGKRADGTQLSGAAAVHFYLDWISRTTGIRIDN